jgi:hypothetical protein
MKMNKYVAALLLLLFIIINETAPFLYNDAYTIRDIKWGWVIGFPLILLIANSFMKDKEE